MPPIYINGQEVVKRYVGIQEVVAAYVGSHQVFSSSSPAALPAPDGFPSVPFGATFTKNGSVFSTNFSASTSLVEGGPGVTTYYVDKATGLDTNPGTSALPYKTIYKALLNNRGVAPKMLLKVNGGTYYLTENFHNSNPEAVEFACVSWDGNPVICSDEIPGLTWTLDASNTYYASVAGYGYANYASSVWDGSIPDAWGDHVALIPSASIAACKAVAGTYYTDTASSRVYVHTSDGRAPDANIHVFEAWGGPGQYIDFPGAPANGICYFENIHFRGGAGTFIVKQTSATYTTIAQFKNCTFKYATGTQSVNCLGNVDIAFENCTASANHGDNFSYGDYGGGPAPRALEIGCESRMCGAIMTGTANQGSTVHNGTTIVRLNGNYHHNENDQIADVNASNSWLIACTSANGRKANYSGFRAGNGVGATTMWLDSCVSTGNTYGAASDSGCAVYKRDYSGDAGTTGSGSFSAY